MFVPFCYRAWVKKMDWSTGQLIDTPDKVISDGDSGYMFADMGRRAYDNTRYRLFGVNAPETNSGDPVVRAAAIASRDWIRTKILGKEVFYRSMGYEDKYGRILPIIWTAEADFGNLALSVNKQMLDLNLAVPYMGELI
jgi:endonuclease YncB( thermonuclease family)